MTPRECATALVGGIVNCSAFDIDGIADNWTREHDWSTAAQQTRLGLSTGYFKDSWGLAVPGSLTAFMRQQAFAELADGEIFTKPELREMLKHSPKWARLESEYEQELADGIEDEKHAHACADAAGILINGRAA
jgi:hypothetical protein